MKEKKEKKDYCSNNNAEYSNFFLSYQPTIYNSIDAF